MRYSLLTLILVISWLSSGIAVFIFSECCWAFDRNSSTNYSLEQVAASTNKSPDGTRWIRLVIPDCDYGGVWETRLDSQGVHDEFLDYFFLPDGKYQMRQVGFLNDETILGLIDNPVNGVDHVEIVGWRRRFPEWWWGHFYRPEVWIFVGLTCVLFWCVIKWLRTRKNMTTASKSPA